MKKILMIASTPFLTDGLTKIELDIMEYNPDFSWEIASGYKLLPEYEIYFRSHNIKYHQLSSKKNVIAYYQSIYRLTKSNCYDSIYVHGNSALMLLETLPAKNADSNYIITHCHNTKSNYPIIHYLFKPIFNKIVDMKIACSLSSLNWAYSGNNTKVIINGVDINKFEFNNSIRNSMRLKYNLDGKFVIGHVGRFNKQKNHVRLINIFETIYKRNNSVRLFLIGEGDLRHKIKQIVEKKGLQDVIYFIDNSSQIYNYYNAMDVFVLPSLYEGLCLSALEAQVNNLPTIMSDSVDSETVMSNKTRLLSLKLSDEKWADIILSNISNCSRTKNNSFRNTKYDATTMMKEIRNILLNNC